MLIDTVYLTVKAGRGGNGAATFRRDGQTAKGGPDGGNGGNGGNVYFTADSGVDDLREFRFRKTVKADDGVGGSRNKMFGKNAPDLTVLVPPGTRITDEDSGETIEIETGKPVLMAHGGTGGRGNTEFKSATNQTPKFAEKGTPGEEKRLFLELRLIAQVGLAGLPNAGKSSILAAITNADPKIGAYPFTTLEPNIGMMGKYRIADIPGLIEGASEGKGLGTKFLRHIERTSLIVHVIDVSVPAPMTSYETVRREFRTHNPELLDKPEIIALNKTDEASPEDIKKAVAAFRRKKLKTITCSVYDDESLGLLRDAIKGALA